MKLETIKILDEKLQSLKKTMFDLFTDEYNSKFCKRNYAALKDTIELYKNIIDDIDSLLKKYCDGWMYI